MLTTYFRDKVLLIALAALIATILSGCLVRSTPPGPNTVGGALDEVSYTFLQWPEGLTVMIWDDIGGTHENNGSGSTDDPVFRQRGGAESPDGHRYGYYLETRDGKTALFTIDGQAYDLSRGSLFLITTKGGDTEIRQLNRDLSTIPPTNEGCEAFARRDPDVAAFIRDSQ